MAFVAMAAVAVISAHGVRGQVNSQWQFAIGAANQAFANYQRIDLFDAQTQNDFSLAYTNLGGLASLGTPPLPNCLLNEYWSGRQTVSCQCPFTAAANEVVMLAPPPFTSPLCYSALTPSIIGAVTSNPDGSLALFRSALPFGCSAQCTLHGVCQQNGQCACPTPANASASGYWVGEDCQKYIPPAGNSSYLASLTWQPVTASETFMFGVEAPCGLFVQRMPTDQTGNYVPTTFFSLTQTQLLFSIQLSATPSQINMAVILVCPSKVDFCLLSNQVGATTVSTVLTLTLQSSLPVICSPNVGVLLPQ